MNSIRSRIDKVLCKQFGVKTSDYTDDSNLDDHPFRGDSLDKIELLMALEEEFDIEIDGDVEHEWVIVRDVINCIEERVDA